VSAGASSAVSVIRSCSRPSPDGTEIAFTGTGGPVPAGQRYVQVMSADGADRRLPAPTPGLLQAVPAWQPLGAGR
jgi:hypothetical protein